ncbi:MAG TPA: metallophosphoesterase family protein [Aliidongia sp.]|nr:metallophosphoesterase family protein [Aliidongia sp.]
MLSRLFRRAASGPPPSGPPGTRLYAVGDIHGRVDLLAQIHSQILADAAEADAARHVVIYLGDYIDRGPASKGVVDLLLHHPLPGFEAVHLKGNHEQALLEFLENIETAPDWLSFGGAATLASYGVELDDKAGGLAVLRRAQAELRHSMPRDHADFYRRLKLSHQEGDFFLVHAGVRPHVPLEAQSEEDLLWIRHEFLQSKERFGKFIVHGHTITEVPEIRPNRIGIDTGAFHTNRLTCLVVQDAEFDFLQS